MHGGLNGLKGSAENIIDEITKKEKDYPPDVYPIFINWDSAFMSTYLEQRFFVRQGKIKDRHVLTSPIYFGTDLLQSVVNTPKAWVVEGEHHFDSVFNRISREDVKKHVMSKFDHNVFFSEEDGETGLDQAARFIRFYATSPVKLLTTPLVSTVGAPGWDNMLRRTKVAFRKPGEYWTKKKDDEKANETNGKYRFGDPSGLGDNQVLTSCDQHYKVNGQGSGALAVFLEEMLTFLNGDNFNEVKYDVTLIGHSMGAIVLNEVIRKFPGLPIKNIVYMGAAASSRRVLENIIPFLQEHPQSRFFNLSLDPKAEDREASVYGLAPSGSLLVWIDEMYTTPETYLERTFGRWANVQKILHVIPSDVKERMFFKVFNYGPCEPKSHGEFDDHGRYWEPKYWFKKETTWDWKNES